MEFVPFGAKDAIKLSVSIVKTLIAQPTKSGHYPTDNDCMKFLMMCQAKRLNPFEQDCWLLGYDTQEGPKFSQITAHQAFLKRAELNKEYDGMESGVVVQRGNEIMDVEGDFTLETDKLVGGWARVHFKTRSRPMFKRIKLTTYTTGKSQWLKNPAGMIVVAHRAYNSGGHRALEILTFRRTYGIGLRADVRGLDMEGQSNDINILGPDECHVAPGIGSDGQSGDFLSG